MDRLSEERVSQASADQRAGRAGRIAPGRAERLWLAIDHAALALQEEAELKRVDLAPVLLNLLQHQASDPRRFAFLEAPPVEAMNKALDLLRLLGALSPNEFRLSPLGRRMAALPLHPRLGRLLCDAGALGLGETGALLCALLSEQDIRRRIAGGPYTADLENTLELWHRGQGHRGQGHRGQGHRGQGLNPGAVRQVRAAIQQLERSLPAEQRKDSHEASPTEIRRLVLAAYPDRVGKRQAEGSRQAVLAHGRGVEIDDGGTLGSSDLFIAIRADAGRRGQRSRGRVYLALALETEDLSSVFPELLKESNEAVFDEASDSVLGLRRQRFGDLLLAEQSGVTVEPSLAASVLAKAALENFELVLRPDKAGKALISRLAFAAHHLPEKDWPKVDEENMRQRLASQCQGRRSLDELKKLDWKKILSGELHGPLRRLLESQVPERIQVPSGRTLAIEYAADPNDPPVLKVKLQEMFGAKQTPSIASGRVALTLHLLAPNGRPAQVTQDLTNFWREGYTLVRKDLRGRYPKHPWPEDPTKARATNKTKKHTG